MIAETIKTLPTTGSLNTEISDYEETRPIFTDMVNELRRLVVKNADLGLLPLECQYLNKSALVSVVGQQSTPVKHFTLKRKPKSANLRAELLQKSSDAQSCLKKISAPTVPLRSRGIPRKMTDTTPLKGIPSRVPTGGFRSPVSSQGQNRPSLSRTPAGRKEGGVKLLEIGEQPLGYAAAKKRKREQEREEQQKKAAEQASAQSTQDIKPVVTTPTTSTVTTTTPDYAAGLTASTVYSQPATPMPITTVKETVVSTVASQPMQIQQPQPMEVTMDIKQEIKQEPLLSSVVQSVPVVSSTPMQQTVPPVPPLAYPTQQKLTIKTEPSSSVSMTVSNPPSLVRSVALPTVTQIKTQSQLQHQSFPTAPSTVQMIQQSATSGTVSKGLTGGPPKIEIISSKTIQPGTIQTSIPKSTTIINQGGNILFTTKTAQPSPTAASTGTTIIQQKPALQSYVLNTSPPGKQLNIQRIITNANATATPTLTTMISRAQHQQQLIQSQQQIQPQQSVQSPTTPTRIVQIKTAPTVSLNNSSLLQNIPPLISTQHPTSNTQPTILNIQTIQQQQQQQQPIQIQQAQTTPQKRTITITAQSPQNNNMIATSVAQILQQQQLQQQQQSIQTTSIVTGSTQQPKYAQVVMSPNVKGKTIFLTNPSNMPSVLNQKGVILRTVDPSGNTVYQQIPLQNVSGLSGATILTSPPRLVKTEPDQKPQLSQIPALVPTSSLHQNIPALTPVVIQPAQQQQQQTQQTSTIPALITSISPQGQQQQAQQIKTSPQTMTIIRPVGSNNVQTMLPQGLTLIQRPGQQPQLVQTIQANQAQTAVGQQQTQTRTIITQIPQQQIQQQQQQQQHTIQFQAAGSPRAGGTTIQLVQQPQQGTLIGEVCG